MFSGTRQHPDITIEQIRGNNLSDSVQFYGSGGLQLNPSALSLEFPICRDLYLSIAVPRERVYTLSISCISGKIYSKEVETAPWLSKKVQVDFASQASEFIPNTDKRGREVFKARLLEIFKTINERVETDGEVRRSLTSPDIRQVIDATIRVDIYPGHKSEYRISLENGENLTFTPEEISGNGKALRVKWLDAYPQNILDITPKGFRTIVNHWAEIAIIHDRETTTDQDSVIEQLQEHLSTLTISTDKSALISSNQGWWEERDSTDTTVWIPSVTITEFLRNHPGQEIITSSQLAKELRRRNILKGVSKTLNAGKISRKCWPFDPEFGGWTRETCVCAPKKTQEVQR
jgi:hypothetical protein